MFALHNVEYSVNINISLSQSRRKAVNKRGDGVPENKRREGRSGIKKRERDEKERERKEESFKQPTLLSIYFFPYVTYNYVHRLPDSMYAVALSKGNRPTDRINHIKLYEF